MKIYPHNFSYLFFLILYAFPYGLAVRIPGFHPGGPGSTPGMGTQTLQSVVQTLQSVVSLFIITKAS